MAAGDQIPWSYIAKRVATAPLTANSATWAGSESAALITATPTLVSGLTYKITLFVTVNSTAGALTEAAFMRVREDNSTGTQIGAANIAIPSTTGNGYPLMLVTEYTAVANGAKSFVVTGSRISGATGTQGIVCSTSRPNWLTVDLVLS
jgi:hypothetical protein